MAHQNRNGAEHGNTGAFAVLQPGSKSSGGWRRRYKYGAGNKSPLVVQLWFGEGERGCPDDDVKDILKHTKEARHAHAMFLTLVWNNTHGREVEF